MALKRRNEKSYSLEEMLDIISTDILRAGYSDPANPINYHVLAPDTFTDTNGTVIKWVMCDSRTISDGSQAVSDELPPFFGETILEAVTKCFVARNEWRQPVVTVNTPMNTIQGHSHQAMQVPAMAPPPPLPAVPIKRSLGVQVESKRKSHIIMGRSSSSY